MKYIKRGRFKECLLDFYARFGITEALTRFAGVHKKCHYSWRVRGSTPAGEAYLRLLFLLEFIGYELEELKEVSDAVLIVGRCIAFGLIDMDSVVSELNVSGAKIILRYVRGERRPRPQIQEVLNRIVSRNIAKLVQIMRSKRSEWEQYFIGEENDRTVDSRSFEIGSEFDAKDRELMKQFSATCAIIRELGNKLLEKPEEVRKALRRQMNKQSPELHLTWDVLHKLMKERKGDEKS